MWCNYAQIYRDIAHCVSKGIFKKVLPEAEYNMFDWQKFEKNDPTIMVELLKHIAQNDNEMSYLGHGPLVWCPRWDDMEWFDTTASCLINYRGWPVHHAIESYGQVGGLLNMVFNRDPMIHSHQNMLQCGLPARAEAADRCRAVGRRGRSGRREGLQADERAQGRTSRGCPSSPTCCMTR